ncbi:hypothetical protein AVEN_46915-1 [Araneus ventricosus]|uniref:Uncharacterized protein n=1 Tax=Araneus ventricosus TaxID=182803 RepID=A0A4Y2REW2_ARAVE|nr:hypothetical protein AVEN_46915-1 [Araneus ventricosus]
MYDPVAEIAISQIPWCDVSLNHLHGRYISIMLRKSQWFVGSLNFESNDHWVYKILLLGKHTCGPVAQVAASQIPRCDIITHHPLQE